MSIAVTAILETNASATAGNVNGGGFNPANTHTINDGVISSGTTAAPTISSATYTFVTADIGAWVYFPTQTSMVNCFSKIASVSAGTATLTAGTSTLNINSIQDWTTNSVAGVATTSSVSSVKFLVDYSRLTTARAHFTNLSSVSASTTITDASSGGLFTPSMAGNHICISAGTNATVYWYEIISYTNSNAVVLDTTPNSGTMSATTGNVGGAVSLGGTTTGIKDSDFFGIGSSISTTSGSPQYFLFNGTYTIGQSITMSSGTNAYYGRSSGYGVIRGDLPIGATRPIINCGTFTVNGGSAAVLKSIILQGGPTSALFIAGNPSTTENCSVFNSTTTATIPAISASGQAIIIKCEACSYNGYAISLTTGPNSITTCYIHDSSFGIHDVCANTVNSFIGNLIVGTVSRGIYISGGGNNSIIYGNTIYGLPVPNGAEGINTTSAQIPVVALNNIITNFGSGAGGAGGPSITADYNNYFGNTSNLSSWFEGVNTVFNNPSYTNVAGLQQMGSVTFSGTTLTDTGQNFTTSGVVAGRDYLYVSSTTGGNSGIFKIVAVGTTTLTTDNTLGTGVNGFYQIITGRNFLPTGSV